MTLTNSVQEPIFYYDDGATSKYEGLVFSVQHRFAQHYTILSNYTYSHSIGDFDYADTISANANFESPYNRSLDRGKSDFDHRHTFVASLLATSPVSGAMWTGRLLRNWQLAAIVSMISGAPINLTDGGVDVSGTGQLNDRPSQKLVDPYPAKQTTTEWFNPSAFAVQPVGTFGNLGRDALTGPGTINLDMALSRTFQFRERLGLIARADFFNIMNHPNWNAPNTSVNSSIFGQITSFGSPRIIQFAMKLIF